MQGAEVYSVVLFLLCFVSRHLLMLMLMLMAVVSHVAELPAAE